MARDIYGRQTATWGGAFSSDDVLLTFSQAQGAATPLMLQTLQFSYQQNVSQLYDLTSRNVYMIAGKPAGQGNMSQIMGPRRLASAFMRAYGQVCNAGNHDLNFTVRGGCVGDTPLSSAGDNISTWDTAQSFFAKYVVLTSMTLGLQTPNVIVTSGMTLSFAGLEFGDDRSTLEAERLNDPNLVVV